MKLDPNWVVGFTDAEGCFHVSVLKHPEMTVGYQVLPEFVVVQHERDVQILYALKRFFGYGVVRRNHADRMCYRVRSLDGLKYICDFFLKHPLKTKKNVEFRKFRRIVEMMRQGKHLTKDGLREIVRVAMQMKTQSRPKLEEIMRELDE